MFNKRSHWITTAALGLSLVASLAAQEKPRPSAQVPRLVRYSGSFRPTNGQPAQPVESATLSVYRDQTGGDSLWRETQNITIDAEGHYAVVLGSTLNEGVPVELFSAGEPRWLGVQFNRPGEPELARVLLVSVPYALKAADAETLGGKPASAYLLAGAEEAQPASSTDAKAGSNKPLAALPTVSSGIPGFIGKFVNTVDLGNSVAFESAGRIGLNTTTPVDVLHAAFNNSGGTMTGYAVQNTSSAAAAYSGMLFYDHTGTLGQFQGFNNATHEYRINNIASGGTINFMIAGSSRFLVRNDGEIDIPGNMRRNGSVFLSSNGSTTVGLGVGALANSTGARTTAVGGNALGLTPGNTGSFNNAFGFNALSHNTSGESNNAHGDDALQNLTTGSGNSAFGDNALRFVTTGSNNLGLGVDGGASLNGADSDNIMIAHTGVVGDSSTTRIGTLQARAFIAGVRGVTTGVANAVTVMIDSNGQLGTASSSRRYKENIRDMADASSGLLKLRPVTFQYKQEFEGGLKPVEYGLIAEEVEEVYPELVAHLANGDVETVQYHKINAMLLNEVQKQHREIEALKAKLAGMSALEARLAALETAAPSAR